MNLIRISCLLVVIGLTATPAVADRIVLRNGRELTGRIVSENPREIVIDVGDGMKMTVRRAAIESIERTAAEPKSAPAPTPDPEPGPESVRPPMLPKKPSPDGRGPREFFGKTPEAAWRSTFGRYPEIDAAKLTRFRAYHLAERAPLVRRAANPKVESVVRHHGHGGALARWKFRYVGMLELHYGDRVKFIGEITAPADLKTPLITFDGGPIPTARRIVVILVKKDMGIERYATTTTFTNRDFRTASLKELAGKTIPVRTYDLDYDRYGTVWVAADKAQILPDLASPFGESPQARIQRYRFRVDWFRTPPSERPGLDPVRLQRNAVRPLAKEGTTPATPALVAKMWGSEATALRLLEREIFSTRERLAALGITPGRAYYVELDRIGLLGEKGITIETFRARFEKRAIEDLLRP